MYLSKRPFHIYISFPFIKFLFTVFNIFILLIFLYIFIICLLFVDKIFSDLWRTEIFRIFICWYTFKTFYAKYKIRLKCTLSFFAMALAGIFWLMVTAVIFLQKLRTITRKSHAWKYINSCNDINAWKIKNRMDKK